MNCPKCGSINNNGSKFCIRCGNNLSIVENTFTSQPNNINKGFEEPIQEIPNVQPQVTNANNLEYSKPTYSNQNYNVNNFQTNISEFQTINTVENNNVSSSNVSFAGYFFIILAVILKPFTAFKEELNKLSNLKNSAILSLIISGVATLVNLLTSMLNVVRVKNFDWSSGGYKTTWVCDNLKKLDYLEVIGKNFLIYLGVIVVIAVLYYLASLIIKKQTNFSRLLGISALAVAPMLICALILSPLLSLIWAELTIPVILIGAIYTIVLLYEGMNSELLLEGNAKYYFNLICFSILGIAAYYLCIKMLTSAIMGGLSSGLGDLMNMFG